MARSKDWNLIVSESHDNWTFAFEYDGSNNPIYIGKAQKGSDKAASVWQIRKLTYSGTNPTDIQWVNGDDSYIFIWNNRASYTYS